MKSKILWTLIVLLVIGAIVAVTRRTPVEAVITSFEECIAAGNPILESYPRQCKTKGGETFTEDIGNEIEKQDLIRISNPRPNQLVTSPLVIKGDARGYWFFEASFPIELLDAQGNKLLTSFIQADGEWMTENFVPFESTFSFEPPQTATGTLILHKDNPSGDPSRDDALIIPVRFRE